MNTQSLPIPEALATELKKLHVLKYKLISINIRKGRYILYATTQDRKEVCIKWNINENPTGKAAFDREKKIYAWLKETTCIPITYSNNALLITDYVEKGYTLREWLSKSEIQQETFSIIIRDIIQKYKIFLYKMNEKTWNMIPALETDQQLKHYLSKILYSGPYQTKVYRLELFRNKLLKRIIQLKYIHTFSDSKFVIHGDFHLNNILINKENAYIIDLENIAYGNVNIEFAYVYAHIWVLIHDDHELVNILNNIISEKASEIKMFDKDEFWKAAKLYCIAALLNRRQHKNEERINLLTLLHCLKNWGS